MASITPVNSGRQSYKGFFYNPSVATQQCTVKISWVGPFEISRGCYEHINFKYTFYELKQSKKTIWSKDLLTFISFCHSSYFIHSFCSQFLFIGIVF